MRVTVNGREYGMRGLRDDDKRLLDVADALHQCDDNTVAVETITLGGTATLMIGNLAPVIGGSIRTVTP